MLALKNAVILDGAGNRKEHNTIVLLERDVILSVGVGIPVPAYANVLDLNGYWLIPGLIDAHTHLGGSSLPERAGNAGAFATYDYAENRRAALDWGVTTVRSAGDYMPDILRFRDKVNAGEIVSPRVLAAGKVFQAKNGHPGHTVYLSDPDVLRNVCIEADDNTDIEAAVDHLIDAGADWIKAFISDDDKMHYGQSVPRLGNALLRRIVEAAHRRGVPVMMHVDDLDDMRDAVLTGADTVEHTLSVGTGDTEIGDALLKLLTEREIWVVPTIVAAKCFDGSIPGIPPVLPSLLKTVGRMIDAGVRIGVGCDSGVPFVPYGECVHEEMELLCLAGMSPSAAITAATGGNAKLLRKDRQFGVIREGMSADLVVLGGDPETDIRNTRDIRMVFRNGNLVRDRFLSCRGGC